MGTAAAARHLILDIAPRLQWEGNHGYCGEVSLVSAGLYYGQYVSQYDVRAIASLVGGGDQTQKASQLLLGVNDEAAAGKLRLACQAWDFESGKSTREFLAWVKQMVLCRHPVAIAVYMNQRLFYKDVAPDAGDLEYDHIVPVLGIGSHQPLCDGDYFDDDTLIFSDNGLWTGDAASPPYLFEYPFASCTANRSAANASSSPYSLNSEINFGLAITGVADPAGDTLPVRVTTDRNDEPPINDGSSARPRAVSLNLTVTVCGLQPGIAYRLYRYDSLAAVPDAGFNERSAQAARAWELRIDSGDTYVLRESIESSDPAIYRAVRASAP